MLSAERDLKEVGAVRALLADAPSIQPVRLPADADEAVVRRLVDAAILPDLLAREAATTLLETIEADAAVVFRRRTGR